MKVGLIGLGNLGTAVGNLIAKNGYEVVGWEYQQVVVQEINQVHTNLQFLPGVTLNTQLRATSDLPEVLKTTQVVFIAVPSMFIQRLLLPYKDDLNPNLVFVNMAKGINHETGLTSFQTLQEMFPNNPCIMLSGPSIASEFAQEMPTVVMIAGENRNDLLTVSKILDNDYFRTRFSDDTVGVELGGILKNIYAIGLGLFDGKNIPSINFRAVYLTIALEEMANIGVALGASIRTFLYLAGMGDLLATSLSSHSHNRHMGELLAKGLSREEIKERMGVLPEGFNTLKVVLYIAEKLHVSIPLARGLWHVINGRYEADQFISLFIKDFEES